MNIHYDMAMKITHLDRSGLEESSKLTMERIHSLEALRKRHLTTVGATADGDFVSKAKA
jgi:hypothetical protein